MVEKTAFPSVLGVGNALVDIIALLDDKTVLEKFDLPPGSMTLVDAALSDKIYKAVQSEKKEVSTGGSVANSMRTFAALGGNGGYIGKIGDDKLGKLFKEAFEKKGITAHLAYSDQNTGTAISLVTPDSERTMATCLGAAAELRPEDFSVRDFSGYGYLFMEGYLVFNHELITAGVKVAKKAGLRVAIDLASFNVVEANLDFLKKLIKEDIDIVFANEEEAWSFTGKKPWDALHEISEMCELAIVKVGKEGSLIKKGNEIVEIGVIPAKAIDTTGAGDSYAAGFLYGLTRGYPVKTCGEIAAFVSGKVVEVVGANLNDNQWTEIKKRIEEIVNS
ncbi:MAG: adenosine kinase [Draconibacterium sp.]|nr:MAG: adenosine kinase [Draconibacterium sp.]